MPTDSPLSKLATAIEQHYFIDREMYYDHCYCRCGLQFNPRRGPAEWAKHVAEVLFRGNLA